ncbi:MAG: sigma-70 family RNA polymerase sigma factor [Ignavibacteriales bacterium]|nr:sigma-70 family RNA polymerase sigma factor [Ignavibacteriales bacterium]
MRKLDDIIDELKPIKKKGYSHKDSKYLLRIPPSERSEEVIDLLMKQHSKLAKYVAKKEWKKYSHYICAALEYKDIESVANYGLLKAINRYNIQFNTEFSVYAMYWIRQVVRRELENNVGLARIPINFQNKINRYNHGILKDNIERKMVEKIKSWIINYSSIDIILNHDGEDFMIKDILTYTSTLNHISVFHYDNPEYKLLRKEIRKRLIESFKIVKNKRNIEILKLRYGLNEYNEVHTLEAIASIYGMTRERIRQICDIYIKQVIKSNLFEVEDISVL